MSNKCQYDSSDEDMMDYEDIDTVLANYLCLMCDNNFTDVNAMFNHIEEHHEINIKAIFNKANIKDEYDWIKMINYLRRSILSSNLDFITTEEWRSDINYQPVLENDNLLFIDYNTFFDVNDDEKDEVTLLKEKLAAQENTISLMRSKMTDLLESQCSCATKEENSTKLTSEDKAYFDGYSHHSIHDTMINDTVRTQSYRSFIEDYGIEYFKDKIVLDVGCGTGILSIFAARAGAKHVFGVDCANIIYDAMAIVKKNKFEDKITLIHGKLEDIVLPCDKVDVVISEWMGYFLIYEAMLDSVLFACRKYLSPTSGHVFPRYFTLNVLGADMASYRAERINCWDSVYGVDMSDMKSNVIKEAIVTVVPAEDVMTSECLIRDYDVQAMVSVTDAQCPQTIDSRFSIEVNRPGQLGAIVTYFDTYFMMPRDVDESHNVTFSTSPQATTTHWQQVALMLAQPIDVIQGQVISGTLTIGRSKEGKRGLDILLHIAGCTGAQRFEFV